MKTVALLADKTAMGMYTEAALRHIMRIYGVRETTPETADVIWFSCSDPDDLPSLRAAREIAGERPLIMGGFEAYCGVPYLAWADAVVVGECSNFMRTWGRSPLEAVSLPNVLTMDKYERGEPVYPDYEVLYGKMPIVKVGGKKRYYFLAGRGCKGKCKFCMTSWTQPYSNCPIERIKQVVRFVETQKGVLTLITNDSKNVIESKVVNAQSIRVVDYLKDPKKYKSHMLRFGIEFWDEATRARMGKPIKDEHLTELINVTKELKQTCELFFIIGMPGDENSPRWTLDSVREFIDRVVPTDLSLHPKIHVKMTYIDPCPHTPIAGMRIDPEYYDRDAIFKMFSARNRRFRTFPTRSAAREAWRAVFHRCTPEEALRLDKEPSGKNEKTAFPRFVEYLRKIGLEGKLEGKGENEKFIKVSIRDASGKKRN